MKAIYEPSGKAKEYGNLACNLYKGCGHKCSYCYAPSVLRMDRQEFYNNPQPREGITYNNIVERISRIIRKAR
jgi:DNA repair photolyase